MKAGKSMKRLMAALLPAALGGVIAASATAQTCDQAWAAYNEFRQRNVMEPDQYPLTEYGARVRAACGKEALPVPEGSDTPPLPIIRKHPKPPGKPADKPAEKPADKPAAPPPSPSAPRSLPRN